MVENHSEVETDSNRDIDVHSNRSVTGSQLRIINDTSPSDIKLTKRRWAVLFAIASFGFFGGLCGETGSILQTFIKLLGLTLKEYVFISQSFSYIPVITTVLAGWFIDKYGLKVTMQFATLIVIIKDSFRALLYNPHLPYWNELKLYYWIFASIASTQTTTLFYCLPLKVSENWFGTSERSFAWTVMMSSSLIGTSIASFSFPRFIHVVEDVYPLFYLNLICAATTALIVLFSITKAKPTHPPSERMATPVSSQISYFKSIKSAFKQRDLLIHLFHEAIFEGIIYSVLMILQDILISSGHKKIFIGNLMSIMAILSVVMLISLSAFVHRLENIFLACKLASLIRTTLIIPFFLVILWPTDEWIIVTVTLVSMLTRSWASPNFNNMTAHLACGVIPEATIAGISVTATSVFIGLSQMIFVQLSKPLPNDRHDYTHSMIFAVVVCLLDASAYMIFFKNKSSKRGEDVESPTTTTRINGSLNVSNCDIEPE